MKEETHESKVLKKKPMNKQINRNAKFFHAQDHLPSEISGSASSKIKHHLDSETKN